MKFTCRRSLLSYLPSAVLLVPSALLVCWIVIPEHQRAEDRAIGVEIPDADATDHRGRSPESVTFVAQDAEGDGEEPTFNLEGAPDALDTLEVPTPPDLHKYIKNKKAAILLGKAFFWDVQVGSDNMTACASCHFHAVVDVRTRNTIAPRGAGIDEGGQPNGAQFRGANVDLAADDFPFHALGGGFPPPVDEDNSTDEIVGSQGVIKTNFKTVHRYKYPDRGEVEPDPIFNVDGVNVRQSTGRNTPTMINAVFQDRQFWDGRANRYFNGVNPFGDQDPDAYVWINYKGKLQPVKVLIDNASLASQAVGPPLSDVEMSWIGRTFPELGRKMVKRRPLRFQRVHPHDSVLGWLANPYGKGLRSAVTYEKLIREAFHKHWWNGKGKLYGKYTHMEANFSFYWGMAVMCYEATLISDDAPYDRWAKGYGELSDDAKAGLEIFLGRGHCITCHDGPAFSNATISQNLKKGMINTMEEHGGMPNPDALGRTDAFYDNGFYNIGASKDSDDLGLGGGSDLGPFALSTRIQSGELVDLRGQSVAIGPDNRVAVTGSFKTPMLRNVLLSGPYFHNGMEKDLEGVIAFYGAEGHFRDNLDMSPFPDQVGIDLPDDAPQPVIPNPDFPPGPPVIPNPAFAEFLETQDRQIIAFLDSLTDERVKYRKAPFDHPELVLVNGHSDFENGLAVPNFVTLEAVGRHGGQPLSTFDEILSTGGFGTPAQP